MLNIKLEKVIVFLICYEFHQSKLVQANNMLADKRMLGAQQLTGNNNLCCLIKSASKE